MIIKAGTYRWVDRPNLFAESIRYGSNFVSLPISTPEYSVDGVTIGSWLGFNILITTAFTDSSYGSIMLSNGTEGMEIPVYADVPIENIGIPYWNYANLGTNGFFPEGYGQIFNITAGTEVDDTFGTWFTENTQMLITAGTYRWNDVPTFPSTEFSEGAEIEFTLPDIYSDGNISVYGHAVSAISAEGESLISYTITTSADPNNNGIPVYYSNSGWNIANITYPFFPEGYGQIFTVTSDQYVPTNFGLWVSENIKIAIEGVWRFRETINITDALEEYLTEHNLYYIEFIFNNKDFVLDCNGKRITGISTEADTGRMTYYEQPDPYFDPNWVNEHIVYDSSGWSYSRRIDIAGKQFIPIVLYGLITANADDITDSLIGIQYDGNLIAALESGESVSLDCEGMIMKSDVIVTVPNMPITHSTATPSTEPILKGVWRFKETIPSAYPFQYTMHFTEDDNLQVVGFNGNGIYLRLSEISVFSEEDGNVSIEYQFCGHDGIFTSYIVYTSNGGWEYDYRCIFFPNGSTLFEDTYERFITIAEDISDSATYIELGDEVIGVLTSGMTAKLDCKDKVMPGKVTITAPKAV